GRDARGAGPGAASPRPGGARPHPGGSHRCGRRWGGGAGRGDPVDGESRRRRMNWLKPEGSPVYTMDPCMLLPFLRGVVLGFVGGIPVGPVNASVIDTALRKCFRRAFATGLGGAFADFVYCLICTLGLGTLFKTVPSLEPIFLGVGG